MKYSKIIEGAIMYMRSPIMYEGKLVYHCGENNKIAKMASELGYYSTKLNSKPIDGKEYKEYWEHIDGVNVQKWVEIGKPPATPTVEERICEIENDIALINEALKEGLA